MNEIGLFPYYLKKFYGVSGSVLTFNHGPYPYLENELKGLEIEFLGKTKKWFKLHTSIIKYLFLNSKRIDVFCVKTLTWENLIYLFIYKILNPKGKSYLKLDTDLGIIKNAMLRYPFNRGLYFFLFNKVDLFSVESLSVDRKLRKSYPGIFNKRLEFIPNTIYIYDNDVDIKIEKEKIILFIGDVGSKVKATAILVDAFIKLGRKDWSLFLVGPICDGFEKFLVERFEKYPNFRDKIVLFGKLQDRRFINNLYDRVAIFCLPSLSESFGIVMIEAASRGCYLITSELTAALDITNNWTMGSKIRPGNFEDLLDVLKISTSPEKFGEILNDGEKLSNYFKSNYSPEVVISRLYNNLFLNTE